MEQGRSAPAAMDMSQFQGAFFEEASEHLAEMESLLVRMDLTAPTADELNAIFRAAHSIKGGSGMFGFQDMTAVTHALESMLDKVRKHELSLRADMVDVLLEASDLLRAQIAHYAGTAGPPDLDVQAMCARIRACTESAASAAPQARTGAAPAAGPAVRVIEIAFAVPADGEDAIDELLAQLRELGELDDVEPPTPKRAARSKRKAAPGPSRTLRMKTTSPDDVILTLFDFVMDARTVRITPVPAAAEASGRPVAAETADGAAAVAEAAATKEAAPITGLASPGPAGAAEASSRPGRRAPEFAASAMEIRPGAERAPAATDASIRVSVDKVDQLINQVGELVITQAMLAQLVCNIDPILHQKLVNGMADLERNTRDLQESVMSIRMMPIAFVFNRFPRLVRDLAGKLGKEVQLVTHGEGTELDKGLIEKISDPLTHLIRNAIDHGLEAPDVRTAAGKPPSGSIRLRAAHQGGNIVIEVSDDGAGLDRARILAKARERGMAVADTMSDHEVWNLIFEPGFSTAQVVTDVSGRGVGMDVVRRNISELGGTVEIASERGSGTRITVRLPLTLAIMDGMSVAVGSEVYILPIASIVESLQIGDGQVRSIAGRGLVIQVRGEYLPVLSLHELFVSGPALGGCASRTMVIVEAEGAKTAVLVDELLGQHQVVVKSLEANYRKVPGVSGATIMGDGRVALILDVATLTRERTRECRPPSGRDASWAISLQGRQ